MTRRRGGGRRRGQLLGTSDEEGSDSAFPARTPEQVKALDDLLEEELAVPGDSGRGSIHPGHPGWAFLPDTPEPADWEETAREVRGNARQHQEALDQAFPVEARNARSAKSHVVRREELERRRDPAGEQEAPKRPWSATEPRWSADRMFSSKQRNWEGLAQGRRHLHHGQLLPGSTESEEEASSRPAKTCWSEGASPAVAKPPAVETDPATPLIQAIRSELQRFQRRQTSGVTIVSESDLIENESRA